MTFILHDESVNTYGFRMLTSGANLEEFRKNPVMFLNHEDWNLPIGRWENIRIEGDRILADALFDENDPRAQQVKAKVEGGFLRAASVGMWPPELLSDAAELKLPGQTMPTVLKWTMREASMVTIGANHNALAMYDRTTGARIDLTDSSSVIRLMDSNIKTNNTIMLKTLKSILHLQDTTSEEEIAAAVNELNAEKERLAAENQTLKDAAAAQAAERRQRQQAEAAALVDAAVKAGRINAPGRENFLKFFDTDFDTAKATLEAIPVRQRIAPLVGKTDTTELKDFAGDWDELFRNEKLQELKDKDPDLFKQKFREKFGKEYIG